MQLAHACHELGYELVVPASWGDELVAHAVLEKLQQRDRDPVIQCTCPFAYRRLLSNGGHLLPSLVRTVPPPVAAARYARRAYAPRPVRISYLGRCPAAADDSIDERIEPEALLEELSERGISIADMPTVFDSVLPPDRRRFVSLPGGCPTQEALWGATEGRMLREVTQATFAADLAQTLVWREHVLVDVATALGCVCAGGSSRVGARYGRVAVMAVEPPRAAQPVVAAASDFSEPSRDYAVADALFPRVPREEPAPGHHEPPLGREGGAGPALEQSAPGPRAQPEVIRTTSSSSVPWRQEGMDDEERNAQAPQGVRSDAREAAVFVGVHVEPRPGAGAASPAQRRPLADELLEAGAHAGGVRWERVSGEPKFLDVDPDEEFAAAAPLRVEVHLEDEPAAAPRPAPERATVVAAAVEEPASERWSWGDLLIGVWLLLAASAAIAALLWRR